MQVTLFPTRAAGLADRMSGFAAHLRMNGLAVGPAETAAALSALTHVDATDAAEARRALKTLLVPNAEIWDRFDALFDAYWFNAGAIRQGTANSHVRPQTARPTLWAKHFESPLETDDAHGEMAPSSRGESDEAEGTEGRLIATRTDNLTRRDLREFVDEESLRDAERAAERIARAIRDRRSRRRKQARRGPALDLRRIQRASISRGGEPVDLFRRARPDRPMQIVALTDVSGSMTLYARPFLAFVRGLVSADTRAEAFLFHTRLMCVTPALRDHDTLRAAGRLSLMAEGFGGGTDIGGALATFVDQHARRLGSRTVVVILSDGYCTGTPGRLAESLARIQRKAGRVVWLNPLLGWSDYAPVAAGIAAALPHLDAHLPANTLQALAALEPEFAKL
ncbi:MAG: VWA domain-containing protein [Pseudomonadota bacterium]